MILMPRSENTGALDCNGFPVKKGDLVEATAALAADLKGRQGIVVKACQPNLLYVKMEKKILSKSEQPEIFVSAAFLWKLISHGVDE